MGDLATDIGGTFTDLIHFDAPTGKVTIGKSLTTPSDLTQGLVNAVSQSGISPSDVELFVHGGTTVINAITERKGVKTALITTAGFRDILEIARGNRPDLYNLRFHKEQAFVPRKLRFEAPERIGPNGEIITPLNTDCLDAIVQKCDEEGIRSVAVMFLHSHVEPKHELMCKQYIEEKFPHIHVTVSHEITREWREYERCNTAVLNAYVQPIVDRYLTKLEGRLVEDGYDCPMFAMQSNGGTTTFESAKKHPITLVESGPAGGVNGAVLVSKLCQEPNVIYLDIGGTTAKCSVILGYEASVTSEYKLEHTKSNYGYPVRTPVVDIVEIGTGGGSIAWFDPAGVLQVGPVSAGGDPGPACYGLGGKDATVTDAKLITGVINPDNFAVGQLKLDRSKAETAMAAVAERLGSTVDEAAVSIIRLVEASMINALKLVSIQRGHDPREFTMIVGGGGGAMHAAQLARELGVKQTIVPLYPGLFSALGMLATEQRRDFVRSRLLDVGTVAADEIYSIFKSLKAEAREFFIAGDQEVAQEIEYIGKCDLRYMGQEHSVTVPVDVDHIDIGEILAEFHASHEKLYTFSLQETPVEFVTFRVSGILKARQLTFEGAHSSKKQDSVLPKARRLVNYGDAGIHEAAIFDRSQLASGSEVAGPLIVEEATSTTMVLPGQSLRVDDFGFLRITEL